MCSRTSPGKRDQDKAIACRRRWTAPVLQRIGTLGAVAHHKPGHHMPPGQCNKNPSLCS